MNEDQALMILLTGEGTVMQRNEALKMLMETSRSLGYSQGVIRTIESAEHNTDARIQAALDMATEGYCDGGHHKMWVIDQMVRILLFTEAAYNEWVAEFEAGENGPKTYEWSVGIAP